MNCYRPRGTLARAIFQKYHNDRSLEELDTRLVSKTGVRLNQTICLVKYVGSNVCEVSICNNTCVT